MQGRHDSADGADGRTELEYSRDQRRAIVIARTHRLARHAERQALTARLLLARAG